jgi:murein DD-endopeptidase MepM/ murein hydrolase activator NlpD
MSLDPRRRRTLTSTLLLPFLCVNLVNFVALTGGAGSVQAQAGPASDVLLEGAPQQGALLRGTAPAGTGSLTLDGKPVPVAPDGRFLIGFDRDAQAMAVLEARLPDGTIRRQQLAVAPRAWRIEHVNVARRPAGPTADYLRRREAELARIAAARTVNAQSNGWRQPFIWPATGRISGRFGSQRVYRGEPASFHSGVDVAPGAGAPVVAPADGVVVLAGPPAFSLEGNLLIIDHGMGLNSAFLHLATQTVTQGQVVRQGQPIGTVGATGRATGPHLHWSMKWQNARLDPQTIAGQMGPA